jgi:oligoribonuclease
MNKKIKRLKQVEMMDKKNNLVWIDLEMTGLNTTQDVIVEAAMIITDNALNIVYKGQSIVIHQSTTALSVMDAWVKEHHTKSGLLKEVEVSTVHLEDAQEMLLRAVQEFCIPKKSPLCGNSVWQDAIFLNRYMPRLMDFLHYRIIDVSSVKEVVTRWYPHNPHARFQKKDMHRALPDIEESIEELKHYRKYFFVQS